MFSDSDILFMRRALQLAELGGVYAAPNPMVGAVIVHNQKIIGEGFHQRCGEAHAEVNAVNSVKNKSLLPESTMYVTLEPCAHHGKTPPCSDLIVEHNFARVVVACKDTFAKVAGRGIEKMKSSGIQADVGLLEEEAQRINKRFFAYHNNNRPYVILKWAQTKDGFFDRLPEDREQGVNWITTPATKPLVHRWRSEEQAIMVGWKTIENDNPSLTVREINGQSPHRFIIDPNCKISSDAKIINDGKDTTILVIENKYKNLPGHIEVVEIETITSARLLEVLYDKNMLSVFIEGGATTLQHFIDDNLWDEARILTGNIEFKRGQKAPHIKKGNTRSSEKLGSNAITYIKNK